MGTDKVNYVLNYLHGMTERERGSVLNKLAFEFGIRLHAREHARPAGRDILSDDDDGDYKTKINENQVAANSYKQKLDVVMGIINKNEQDAQVFDIYARPTELRKLLNILTVSQLSRLNFYGLCRMLRVATQAQDATNPTAYILSSYKNLLDQTDYKKHWRQQQENDQQREFLENVADAAANNF